MAVREARRENGGSREQGEELEELEEALEATRRFWLGVASAHSAKGLRRRGFRRSLGDILLEANHRLADALAGVPERAHAQEASSELTTEEAEVLERGGADLSSWRPGETDPQVESLVKYTNMLATGSSTREAAEALGVSEGRVRQRVVSEKTLLGVKTSRGWRLPVFQFEGGSEVPNIGKVLKGIDPGLHPLSVANWFSLPKPELYLGDDEERLLSPREWLLSGGDPETLLPFARDL